jgi:hypothetical protein
MKLDPMLLNVISKYRGNCARIVFLITCIAPSHYVHKTLCSSLAPLLITCPSAHHLPLCSSLAPLLIICTHCSPPPFAHHLSRFVALCSLHTLLLPSAYPSPLCSSSARTAPLSPLLTTCIASSHYAHPIHAARASAHLLPLCSSHALHPSPL